MARWLFKEEPDHYSFTNLERDGSTTWDGVSNALALKHLRNVKSGDRILFYHTGDERAIVGEMVAVSEPYTDPAGDDAKAVVVDVKAVKRWSQPVTLAQIKEDTTLANWELVRIGRLSVMPVTDDQWTKVYNMSRKKG
jgi:predicted RNA-binding protein with PUA-like domain